MVVVFHDGLLRPSSGGLHGGFLGVDIFFVLSGYLITTLLLVEHRSNGRIDYRNFWARRMRRLLPAVLLLVVGVAVYARTIALQSERAQIRSESLATLAYVQNWHLIFTKTNSLVSLLNHAWSLAVEEQWYLVWPVVIVVLIGLTRRRGAALVGVILGLAAASAAWTWHVYANGVGEAHAYWGTDCRAQELLVGAALAALLPIVEAALDRRPHVADGVGVVGVLAVAGFVATQHPGSAVLAHGGYLVLACCVAAVIVAARSEHRGVVQQSLSWRPLRSLGLISYGVYLWHWPVIVFAVLLWPQDPIVPVVAALVSLPVALAIALR